MPFWLRPAIPKGNKQVSSVYRSLPAPETIYCAVLKPEVHLRGAFLRYDRNPVQQLRKHEPCYPIYRMDSLYTS